MNNSENTINKHRNENIKVCIRVRPLLQHEDSELWFVNQSTIYTQR